MRDKLAELSGKKRQLYFGTVDRVFKKNKTARVCLTNIHNEEGDQVSDHSWLIDKRFNGSNLKKGDLIKFEALVKKYTRSKDFKWTIEDQEISEDYGFYDLKGIKVVRRKVGKTE